MSNARRQIQVPPETAPLRVDKLLVDSLAISRAKAKKLFEEGAVRVNGLRCAKGAVIKGGDVVEVEETVAAAAEEQVLALPQAGLDVREAYLDDAVVVLDKPSGMPSHPLRPGEMGTVANHLAFAHPECLLAHPEEPREVGLVHRLDIETSGLIAAARTPAAYEALRAAFQVRAVEKEYAAATLGPLADEGEVDLPLAHAPGDARRMVPAATERQARELKARPARTSFWVVERRGDLCLLRVRIDTGVMHQIRAHLAAIGAPILGDVLYGGPALPHLGRHFLHAAKLGFQSPATRLPVAVESPLPADLQQAWSSAVDSR